MLKTTRVQKERTRLRKLNSSGKACSSYTFYVRRRRDIFSSSSRATRNCCNELATQYQACWIFEDKMLSGDKMFSTSNQKSVVCVLFIKQKHPSPPNTQYPELPSPDIDISIKECAVSIDQWILFICL